ncbi:hypothetical protein QJS04_geneDACA015024 [Acorus gramineus]|uniref:Protein unc-13 homolog n=1 Tax=Acorus gramineus TaxID=55184 RepID=A0AAV9BY18_ACOGR|nr:hypothetical protein QJS04_geneDACA015024 [Acorus gramineus]
MPLTNRKQIKTHTLNSDFSVSQISSSSFFRSEDTKGELLELSEAIRIYHDSLDFPTTSSFFGDFFLVTNPVTSGSPPTRPPPPTPPPVPIQSSSSILPTLSKSQSFQSEREEELTVDDIEDFEDEDEISSLRVQRRQSNDASDLALLLPSFSTGITDDDLRETAYEILLACAGASGGLIVPSKEKKKDRRSKLMRKLARSKGENVAPQSQQASGLVGLLETMRVQMELNILEEGLLNHPVVKFGEFGRRANELRALLIKIEESEFLSSAAGEIQRLECLRSLREIATALAERPARGDLTGEVSHWADGYHLNVRLYEKLLLSVFDILDEGKLTEEVEEILELLKSTWRILGITETIHDTCYAWVLFRQFVITGEQQMLQHAIELLRKIPLKEQRGPKERLYLKSLLCSVEGEDGSREFTFLQSFLLPIQKWADKKLVDYHLHFAEGSTMMAETITAAMIARRLLQEDPDQVLQTNSVTDREQIELYISSSMRGAFGRIMRSVEATRETAQEHFLASLAEEAKKLLKKDSTIFLPILSQWHPQAAVVSASLLHKLYGNKLKPFLDRADYLTEDVVSVFPAADSLEQYIILVIRSACGEDVADDYYRGKITPYEVETISGTLVLRWVNSQLGRISGWVERAIQQERWDPLSPQQRHGSSVVEVYRIVEETVDQFFALKVPMRPEELNSLFRGLDNAFQVYTQLIVDKLASKEDLIPPVPVLTRYKKEMGIKAFVKKEVIDHRLPDDRRSSQINVLSTSTLCVRLNTLHYAISQLDKLEDSIHERWKRNRARESFNIRLSKDDKMRSSASTKQKNAFDGSRKDINAAVDRICEFTGKHHGTKIIFWDMRESYIENLYKPSVSQCRLEALIDRFDTVLNQLCDVIVEPLRDRLVTGLLQASLDGFTRIILDGGPARVFFPSDAKLVEDDLDTLKEFFISGGDGLPRGMVENCVARVRPIIKWHGYETRMLIDELRSAGGTGMQDNKTNPETLLRILCHRSDSAASQFLKKQYKIPKSAA